MTQNFMRKVRDQKFDIALGDTVSIQSMNGYGGSTWESGLALEQCSTGFASRYLRLKTNGSLYEMVVVDMNKWLLVKQNGKRVDNDNM